MNIGLAGYGYAGQTFHAPLIVGAGLQLAAISTSQAERARQDYPSTHVVSDFDALLAVPELDAVVIATPNDTHFDLACRAIAAGKHVVVDKPVTVTLDEAEHLERHAAQHGRLVAPFHNRRWDGDFLTVRALLANGRLGRLTHYESHFDRSGRGCASAGARKRCAAADSAFWCAETRPAAGRFGAFCHGFWNGFCQFDSPGAVTYSSLARRESAPGSTCRRRRRGTPANSQASRTDAAGSSLPISGERQ